MISNQTKFRPVYGKKESTILSLPITEGFIYFADDTGKIFLDADGKRKQVGGSGGGGGGGSSSIVWSFGDEETGNLVKATDDASDGDPVFYIALTALEGGQLPDLDALIINSDGRFFKVTDNTLNEHQMITIELIAVSGGGSGGGGGGGGGTSTIDLFLSWNNIDVLGATYIYGQSSEIVFLPKSTADEDVSLVITARDLTGRNPDVVRQYRVLSETPCVFNANLLPVSDNIEITALVNSNSAQYNRGRGLTKVFSPIRVLEMYLEKPSDFMIGIQENITTLEYTPYFNGLGDTNTPVNIYYQIDGELAVNGGRLVAGNSEHKQYINIPQQSHGMHTVKLWLVAQINDVEYSTNFVSYEVPWVDSANEQPIIWINGELGTIVQYENAVIEYMVYSAVAARQGSPIEVSLYQDGVLLNTEEVTYSSTKWLTMDLTANYKVGANSFVITCGAVSKRIDFTVTTEGARDLSLRYPEQLEMSFDSLGRSSKEIKANRIQWKSQTTPKLTSTPYEAILEGFNWFSNGWKNDNDGMGSYLSVANGASVRIPMGTIAINTTARAWTFEVRFRVRNAKKFATLVTDIPKYRYTLNGIDSEMGKEKTLEEIEEIGGVVMLDEDGNPVMNEANTTKKIVETNRYIAMKYLNNNNEGFAIGTQEAYFNTSGTTVNVKYKEGDIINITFVVDRTADALSIYLNGILAGVTGLSAIPAITMENIPFLINSEYCDFDLYKFRVYPVALSMPDVIHNYISDIKDISLYDENQLTDINDATALSYQAVMKYNEDHPDDPTMPIQIIDMTQTPQGTDLPHYKGANRNVSMTFINPTADYKLEHGDITPWDYYIHCPSYTADNVDLNVQGTSSQKYPRRNFKSKFKSAKNTWVFTKGPLAGKPIASDHYFTAAGQWVGTDYPVQEKEESDEDFAARVAAFNAALPSGYKKLGGKWHMDSETLGINKFTLKIDYMESSGSYNTGFANLLGSGIYSKHPLEDLNINNFDTSVYRTSVYGFPMLTFHKVGENQYIYIGRYNMNTDKSANERYGFEEKVKHPYVTKTTTTVDPETGQETTTTSNLTVKDVAECWELRDNQGTWCSWRYPTQEMRNAGFHSEMIDSNPSDPKIEVVQHFEARYHKNADQFEYAQNILLGKENTDDFSGDIGGTTNSVASAYCYSKLKNLEVLFNWLDSTDTKSITNVVFDNPIEYEVSGKLTKQVSNPEFTPHLKPQDAGYKPEFLYIEDTEEMERQGVTYETRTVNGTQKIIGIFTKDSTEYRRQKFYAEFDKHLDRHYCAVYFVMTELMLCYDSRGKNMMIATFGPREEGGDYIWYPIFYDIDTQLGLNNVGAKLWDYDEDCSENGTFSTKDSVLWTNFYDVFKNTVISTYRTLRNGKIDYDIIEAAYRCKAGKTFNSYAMMGKRPIIAIGLDEYYKYVLPTKQPWKNQEGAWVTANYLYACQGDRILSRELLINNRLLYMDSKWLGGSFTISTGGMSGLMFRGTGNKATTTSDKYLDNEVLGNGQVYGQYPVPYFDAIPEYYVTPYLNFYVTTFVDENVFQTSEAYDPAKYPDGIPTPVSPSVLVGYQSGAPDQQLNYFAGSEYISSLGDLSLKYINQADIVNTPRLLDISLGSDIPGYFNNETLDPFNLHTELDINGNVKAGDEKSLLSKIILTNVKGVNKYLDVRSPDKLTEFRALGTSLTYALFADGAPLTTVHLPNTVTRLIFSENKDLTKILTSTPVIVDDNGDGTYTYRDPSTYEGLYIEGVTDYTDDMAGQGSPITEISFDGDALGYGSYTILDNVVKKKNGTGRENRLQIRMNNITWTPYVQVEYGEEKRSGVQYYYLTDHSTYEPYTGAASAWADDTLNARVYTYDVSRNENTIQDLSLLDIFIQDMQITPAGSINQFTNNIESMLNQKSYPTIAGELYVSNASGTAIKESDLSNKYGEYWPNLKIRVANVDPAYIVKFMQKLDSGKYQEIDIKRYEKGQNVHPEMTSIHPTKQNYDFRGWTLDPSLTIVNENDVQTLINTGAIYDPGASLESFTFDDEGNDVFTFYAVFSITEFTITFKDPQTEAVYYSYQAPYGSNLYDPDGYWTTNETELSETERYKFVGWSRTKDNWLARNKIQAQTINLSTIVSQNIDQTFYAVFIKEDCLTTPTDDKYFNFSFQQRNIYVDDYDHSYDVTAGGYTLSPKTYLAGKITLPATHVNPNDNKEYPIVRITGFQGFSSDQPNQEEREQGIYDSINVPAYGYNITHIYWYGDTSNFRQILSDAFNQAGNYMVFSRTADQQRFNGNRVPYVNIFKYFQLPENTRRIESAAFYFCYALQPLTLGQSKICYIGDAAFNCAFSCGESSYPLLHLPGSLVYVGDSAFEQLFFDDSVMSNGITTLQFGGEQDASNLQHAGIQAFNFIRKSRITNFWAYVPEGSDEIFTTTIPSTSCLSGTYGNNLQGVTYTRMDP